MLQLPVALGGSYIVELRVARSSGNAGVLVLLPIHGRHVALVIDHEGRSGLTDVDGQGLVADNPTFHQARPIAADRVFGVKVTVQWSQWQTAIRAVAANQTVVDFSGDVASLSLPRGLSAEPRCVAIGTLGSGAAFTEVGLTLTDGEARWAVSREEP